MWKGGKPSADILDQIEAVYRTRYTAFLRVATGMLDDPVEAADAVHDGFVDAVRRRSTFRGDASVEAWIWTIVLNAARRTARAVPRHDGLSLNGAGPMSVADDASDARVMDAIAKLPERQRIAVFLRYFADLDYRAIATILGVRVGTVSASLSAAHDSVRNLLRQEVPR